MTEATRAPASGLRSVTRASAREHVAEQALRLFDERGFDQTTIEDIASAVGMSTRSFFRYFPVKEDVVIGDPAPFGLLVRDAAQTRPTDEPVWQVLRNAFAPVEESTAAGTATGLRTMRVMMSTASLRARNLEKHIAWAALLEPVIIDRLDGPEDSRAFRAQTLIHTALACLDVALAEWTRRDGATPVGELLDRAFATARA
ncbi:transcriptional regulator, tetR family [Sanguibacter keddieii DSM 10542]|uniref:Transcriptional regulator, tetR family n=1 Tax=Sanguibacter keddieii (strain ATCC 51767 / DSM 10542 / NCFB 3025 / ST-74) TaxID=446469 RepID=D1BF99_SANKS|nr:TetR family transcriptional regulator [Sanguibacter keddieii]ACZ21395.1 transcriptional regulator, tetR family [Sanguibacter keddieii DSM 10542]